MEQFPDWVNMVNVNLADHEARMRVLEQGNGAAGIALDDAEYTWPPGNLDGYDVRTATERMAARLDNHDQRLRAIDHRLLLIEVELRELAQGLRGDGR